MTILERNDKLENPLSSSALSVVGDFPRYFFVHLPSITRFQFFPSWDISNLKA